MRLRHLAAAAFSVTLAGCQPAATTLCEIVASPETFNGKRVTFQADVLTDWHHGTVLTDHGCEAGVALTSTDPVAEDQARALVEAIGSPMTGGFDRTAHATFTGRFHWKVKAKGEEQPAYYNPRQFMAEEITNVSVKNRS